MGLVNRVVTERRVGGLHTKVLRHDRGQRPDDHAYAEVHRSGGLARS